MTLDTFDILLIVIFVALFGGAILRIGGYIVYALILLVAIVFLLRLLGIML